MSFSYVNAPSTATGYGEVMASIRERTTTSGETTWAVLYRHGTRQTSRTFATAGAATQFRALVDILGPEGALKAAATEREQGVVVAEVWAQFIAWKARDITPRTLADYRRDWTNWLEPWFGHREAEMVDEADVQKWVDHMAETLGPKTVADRHMLLHSLYQFGKAKSRRLVTHNPCLETALPKRGKRKPPKGTTTPEFRAILIAAARRNPDAADLILYLGETGWRFSEGIALDVRDIEDDGERIWVDMTRVFRVDGKGRQYIAEDEAKSEAGFRRVVMFPETAAMIRRRIVGKAPGDLLFTNSHGRQWNQNTFLRETWPRIIAEAGIATPTRKPTPHWLRHMHVAVLSAAGVPMQEIQRRIGHEHYSTTVDVYGGRIGDISQDAMDRAAALMSGQRAAPGIAPIVQGSVVSGVVLELD